MFDPRGQIQYGFPGILPAATRLVRATSPSTFNILSLYFKNNAQVLVPLSRPLGTPDIKRSSDAMWLGTAAHRVSAYVWRLEGKWGRWCRVVVMMVVMVVVVVVVRDVRR